MGRQKAVFDACRVGGRAIVVLPRHGVGLERCLRRQRHGVAVVRIFLVEAQHAVDSADGCRAVALADELLCRPALGCREARDARREHNVAALAVCVCRADRAGVVPAVAAVRIGYNRAAGNEDVAALTAATRANGRRAGRAVAGGPIDFCRDRSARYRDVAARAVVSGTDAGGPIAALRRDRAAFDDDATARATVARTDTCASSSAKRFDRTASDDDATAHATLARTDGCGIVSTRGRQRTRPSDGQCGILSRTYARIAAYRVRDGVHRAGRENDRRVAEAVDRWCGSARVRYCRAVERHRRACRDGDLVVLVHASERVAVVQRQPRRGVCAEAERE